MSTGTAPNVSCAMVSHIILFVATTISAQDTTSPSGDAASGRALVQSSTCLDCHRIGDTGSRLGPALSDIGSLRTSDRLLRALVAPDDEVLPENRFVRVVPNDGPAVTGKLLNQDAFSIQLMTPDEQLKTHLKSRLREFAIVQKGLMPSYEGTLSAQQLTDVVSYLGTLKGATGALGATGATGATGAMGASGARILNAEREPQNWLTYSGS